VLNGRLLQISEESLFIDLGKDLVFVNEDLYLNCTTIPEECEFSDMRDVVCIDAPEDIYISPVGCYGIVRRKQERNLAINPRLEEVLLSIAATMSAEDIDKRSRVQKRGRFSDVPKGSEDVNEGFVEKINDTQISLFDNI